MSRLFKTIRGIGLTWTTPIAYYIIMCNVWGVPYDAPMFIIVLFASIILIFLRIWEGKDES